MEFLNSIKFIAILFVLLLAGTLLGCAKPNINSNVDNKPTIVETIGNTPGLVRALTCMFAPSECAFKH